MSYLNESRYNLYPLVVTRINTKGQKYLHQQYGLQIHWKTQTYVVMVKTTNASVSLPLVAVVVGVVGLLVVGLLVAVVVVVVV